VHVIVIPPDDHIVFLNVFGGGFLGACSSLPPGPTYTQDELRVICERRGGWWRGNLIPGLCEYQTASNQAP